MNARWKALVACLVLMLANRAAQASAQETVKYIHTDALGSIVAVTNANGQVIERRAYEPYGAQLLPDMQDGPGYTGHVQDAATGLVYMQQRYYDPQIGRFLSVDPIPAYGNSKNLFNRYGYANSNPYRYFDPDGRVGCTGTKIKIVCDSGGVPGLRTSARSGLDTGDLARAMSVDPAPNVRLRAGVQLKGDSILTDLQALSNSLDGKDIDVISGYRSKKRQDGLIRLKNDRAAKSSQHTLGSAADIKISGMSQKEVGAAAHKLGRFERVNVYRSAAAGVHVDYLDVGEGSQMYYEWGRVSP